MSSCPGGRDACHMRSASRAHSNASGNEPVFAWLKLML
jgi:hypothetical protein